MHINGLFLIIAGFALNTLFWMYYILKDTRNGVNKTNMLLRNLLEELINQRR
jgi:hypothetical protein